MDFEEGFRPGKGAVFFRAGSGEGCGREGGAVFQEFGVFHHGEGGGEELGGFEEEGCGGCEGGEEVGDGFLVCCEGGRGEEGVEEVEDEAGVEVEVAAVGEEGDAAVVEGEVG